MKELVAVVGHQIITKKKHAAVVRLNKKKLFTNAFIDFCCGAV